MSNLTVNKKALIATLKTISSLKLKNYLEILKGNIVLSASKGVLSIATTDLSTSFVTTIEIDSTEVLDQIVVDLKKLQAILKVIKTDTVDLSTLPNSVKAIDYPLISDLFPFVTNNTIKLSKALTTSLQKVASVASTDDSKQVLIGVNIQIEGSALSLAATDGHRLAVKKSVYCEAENLNYTITAKHLPLLSKLGFEISDLSFSDNFAIFDNGRSKLAIRLVEGRYPDYDLLSPSSFSNSQSLKSIDVIEGIEYIKAMADSKIINLTLGSSPIVCNRNFDGDYTLSHNLTDVSPHHVTECNLNFNIDYLLSGFKTLECESVKVSCNGKTDPVVLTDCYDSSFTYLLMPIQLR